MCVSLLVLASSSNEGKKESSFFVKVLLNESKGSNGYSWQLGSTDGFFLSDTNKDSPIFYLSSKKLVVTFKNNFLYINGKKYLKKQIKIVPKRGDISYNGNFYQGSFIVVLRKKNSYLVNRVSLEDYIFAVLRSESWPGWPLEVNKVFAVAIRSYVISKVLEAKKCNRLFHIKNNNSHQTYHGCKFMDRNGKLLRTAVAQTEGIFLTYAGVPIDAMYDSCCGEVVPAAIEGGVDFKKAPYLARDYSCDFCKKCCLYNWQAEYNLSDLEKLLSKEYPGLRKIKSLRVSKKDGAGLVKEVTVRCSGRSYKIPGEKFYSLLKEVKSFCFSLKKRGNILILKGKGFGHHIGLCQWGARQMVRELYDYKQILKFYYPGTEFVRLG